MEIKSETDTAIILLEIGSKPSMLLDSLVAPLRETLSLPCRIAAAIPAGKELYRRRVEATDRQIDALVVELYGLTKEEIAVVERRNRRTH